ncbi:hypothetical protein [Streptomyces sp. RTd22]|uniref:hypothetical protein n=1 Tax=Streptomyces sp. RTd22 TaxID=1841249 RepID=UPI0007C5A2FF|nr:hypothetical protein [Streptomyces sp. RTd22]
MARGNLDDIFEEDAPATRRAGRSRRNSLDEDDAPKTRRGRQAQGRDAFDEDVETLSRGFQRTNSARKQGASAGWDAFDEMASSGGQDFEAKNEMRLEITKDPQLIRLMQPEPFDSYEYHYVREITSGKRSFRGLAPAEDCPLCDDLDHYGRKVAAFNVALWDEDDQKWVHKVWEVGIRAARTLQAVAKDPKKVGKDNVGDLTSPQLYIAVHKTGKGTKTEYHVEAVKARDVESDWDADELTDDDYERLSKSLYSDAWERHCTRAELEAAVQKVLNGADDDEDDD